MCKTNKIETFKYIHFVCIHKVYTMKDIFDNKILCGKCDLEMQKAKLSKNGFLLRMVICENCNGKVVHPVDEQNYNKFISLKNKKFNVKMRLVGNSYTVSIPSEILSFMRNQERMMDNMVRLCFEEMGKVSLSFNELNKSEERT